MKRKQRNSIKGTLGILGKDPQALSGSKMAVSSVVLRPTHTAILA